MSKISPEEHAQRLEAVRYARGTMGLVEGYRQSAFATEQERRFLAGEITIDEAIAETLRHYGLPDLPEPRQD
ncbi:antitoxin VbhA family protein [uncultured Pseudomonas sp.]|uniref:antitoxin VbhA family protein n=1 Tax=uncultured Pseudomonas sp. TaxID=114707 RepID=UPI0025FDEBF7|nr:antitoxin VbhA family protein [uncultured Pseudomonas sp.]